MQKGILGSVIAVLGVAALLITMVPSAFALTVKAGGGASVHYRQQTNAAPSVALPKVASAAVSAMAEQKTTAPALTATTNLGAGEFSQFFSGLGESAQAFASAEDMEKALTGNSLFPASGKIIIVDETASGCSASWDQTSFTYQRCGTLNDAAAQARKGDLIALTPDQAHYLNHMIRMPQGVHLFGTLRSVLVLDGDSHGLAYEQQAGVGDLALYSGFTMVNNRDRLQGSGLYVDDASGLVIHNVKFASSVNGYPFTGVAGNYPMYNGVTVHDSRDIVILNSAFIGVNVAVRVTSENSWSGVYLDNNELTYSRSYAVELLTNSGADVELVNNGFFENQLDLRLFTENGRTAPTVDLTANGFYNSRHRYNNPSDYYWCYGPLPYFASRMVNVINQNPQYQANTFFKLSSESPYREAGWNRLGGAPTNIGIHGGIGWYNFLPVAKAR